MTFLSLPAMAERQNLRHRMAVTVLIFASAGAASAQTAAGPAQGLSAARASGGFVGIVACGPAVDRVELQFLVDERGAMTGQYRRTSWLNPTSRMADSGAVPIVGSYDAVTGAFQLRGSSGARGAAVALRGALQADGDGLVAGPQQGAGGLCETVVARRGNVLPADWAALDREAEPGATGGFGSMMQAIPEKLEQARDMLRRECAPPIMSWLQQLQTRSSGDELRRGAVGLLMFADEAFVPHFGKPFPDLSVNERMTFRVQQMGSCANDPRVRELHRVMPVELTRAFHNMRDFPDVAKAAARIPFGELRRWREGMETRLAALGVAELDPQKLDWLLGMANTLLAPLWSAEARTFEKNVVALRVQSQMQQLQSALEALQVEALGNLVRMWHLAQFTGYARQRFPSLRPEELAALQARVAAFANDNVLASAEAWAAAASSPAQAELLAKGSAAFPELAAILTEPRRIGLDQRMANGRGGLVARIAAREREALQREVESLPPGAAGVARLVASEQAWQIAHASLLGESAFRDVTAERTALRAQRLTQAAPEIVAMIDKARFGRELTQIRNSYLTAVDGAYPGGQRVLAALEAQSARVAPFTALPAGAYLDALYAGDTEALRTMDTALAQRYRAVWEQQKPLMQMYDALISAAAGRRRVEPVVSQHLQRAYERASPVVPMMALYLGRYGFEKRFERCVEKDAVVMPVRYRTVETKKLWGFESRAVTSDETVEFIVNLRFKAVAEALGVNLTQSEGFVALERMFFSPDAAPTTLESYQGIRALMAGFECDSPVLRRLEDRMVQHFLHR